MRARLYTPGTDHIDITAPGGIDALLAFHRRTFGDAVMKDGEGGDGEGGDGEGGDGGDRDGSDGAGTFTDPESGEKYAFPEKTPVKDMTAEQQAEYWRHKARKHEGRAGKYADYDAIKKERDELKAATQTDAEKAIDQAKADAKAEGKAEAQREHLPRLVTSEFKVAAAGRIPSEKLATILAPLDLTKFLTADGGEVDTDKVQQYVDGLAPAGGKWPDMGQGRHKPEKTSGVGAGRDLFNDRRSKKQ
ncbi:hypothetical protein [Isoptericola sp. NPDC056605]|uniref:hypothetical protein n=1 Tax=Isoptericola sp. NPDC056605 TaxID=3345876 RepID=UPI003687524F